MELQDRLREQLHALFPEAKDCSGNREVSINCPLCGFEGRRDTGRHMYISLGYDGKTPMYNCFRDTEHRGKLTKSALERFTQVPQCIDTSLMQELEIYDKKVSHLSKFRLNRNNIFNIRPCFPRNDKISMWKLNYINNRLGLSLSLNNMAENKIVLNLYDILSYNRAKLNRTKYIADFLNMYFIGFLTNNNSTLIMRNLADSNNKSIPSSISSRYIKYPIVETPDSGYYIIPSTCDIFKHIDIHLAEGTFDILSVFYNICNGDRSNKIYASIGGNTYLKCMKYFIAALGLIDISFHIYIDNDITNFTLEEISRVIKPLDIEVFVHMNVSDNQKDFGVSSDKIKDHMYKL